MRFEFTINGEKQSLEADPMTRLLDVLRESVELTGKMSGLGRGQFGCVE